MKKRVCFSALIVIILLAAALAATAAYAYFNAEVAAPLGNYSVSAADNTVSVGDEKGLRMMADCEIFNSEFGVSDSVVRKSIVFGADIKLTSDLTVTADCHFDLNGRTLDLNGHNLIVSHTFAGDLLFTNGTLLNGETFNLIFKTPFAAPVIDAVCAVQPLVEQYDEDAALQAALDFAAEKLERGDAGCYYGDDVDFIRNFCGYGFEYEYVVPAGFENIITSAGRVTAPTEIASVEITVRVSAGGASKERAVVLNLVSRDNTNAWSQIALELFDDYFSYYKTSGTAGGVSTEYYAVRTGVVLPAGNSYIGDDFSYSYQVSSGGAAVEDAVKYVNGVPVLYCDDAAEGEIYLTVTPLFGGAPAAGGTVWTGLLNLASYGQLDDDTSRIIDVLFPDGVEIWNEGDGVYSTVALPDDAQIEALGADGAQYSLSDADGIYEIADGVLRVKAGAVPAESTEAYLNIKFLFGKTAVEKTVRINYRELGSDFTPYYSYFDRVLASRTDYYNTYLTFRMPVSYDTRRPFVGYKLYLAGSAEEYSGEDVKLYFCYDGGESQIDMSAVSGENFRNTVALMRQRTSYFEIRINPELWSTPDDRTFELEYWYTFTRSTDTAFSVYEKARSTFVLKGFFYKGKVGGTTHFSQSVHSQFHDAYCSSCTRDESGAITAVCDGSDYLFTSDLQKRHPSEFALVLNSASDVSDYTVLEYLTNTAALRLSSQQGAFTDADLVHLTGLVNLEELYLDNNSLTEIDSLTSLVSLKILDVSDNNITYFSCIPDFPANMTAYIYNNTPGGSGIFDWINRLLYGSTGSLNLRYYIEAQNKNITVYNENADTPFGMNADMAYMYYSSEALVYQHTVESEAVYDGNAATENKVDLTPVFGKLDISQFDASFLDAAAAWEGINQVRYTGNVYFENVSSNIDAAGKGTAVFRIVWMKEAETRFLGLGSWERDASKDVLFFSYNYAVTVV